MRQLVFIRHAKSAWSDSRLADFERPLARRGIRDLKTMGGVLDAGGDRFDLLLCSAATRAQQTLEGLRQSCARPLVAPDRIRTLREIYDADSDGLLEIIGGCPKEVESLALIGHNPALQTTVEWLTGKPFPHPKYSTCAIAWLELDLEEWRAPGRGCGTLRRFLSPKMVGAL